MKAGWVERSSDDDASAHLAPASVDDCDGNVSDAAVGTQGAVSGVAAAVDAVADVDSSMYGRFHAIRKHVAGVHPPCLNAHCVS